MKKSHDHGRTWGELRVLRKQAGAKWHMGSAITDMITGKIFLMCGGGWLQSLDNGETWTDWNPKLQLPEDGNGGIGSTHGSAPGIQLQYGRHQNRLIWPARTTISKDGYDDRKISDRRQKCYSTVIYSDDHGETLERSNVFHRGTGEACLVELINGDIYFNARAYFNDNMRRVALSRDGGMSFTEEAHDTLLREGPQGCNAGMLRYPEKYAGLKNCLPANKDVVLFANPDTDGPDREHGVVRLSLDGGYTWAFSRSVTDYGDWFDYCSMTVAVDGSILLMYKTTPTMKGLATSPDECCSMALARFDLEWLTKQELL